MNSFMSQSATSDSFHQHLSGGNAMSPSFNGGGLAGNEQRLTLEQTLQLMNQVSSLVKANDFSSNLANNIYILCQQLKNHGQALEQNHKNELNKCFIALRQACCRDSGQLGTPCRLKMMELVELRAMGWRPNLAHTQYYLNRPEQPPPVSLPRVVPEQTQSPIFNPASHSPFNPFALPPPQATPPQQQPLFLPQDLGAPASAGIQVPPGYFFIPGNWQNPLMHHHQQQQQQQQQHQHLVDAATAAQWAATRNAAAAAAAAAALMGSNNMVKANAALGLKTPRLIGNMALSLQAANPSTNPKSNKSAQLREEVTIRNCDSGKIMGVKGRRVAVVEELSKTVISFQKVDPKNKDRVLTITGSTEETIQFAKRLIEETIRRNVSPNRFQDATTPPQQASSATSPSTAATPSASATTPSSTAAPAIFGNPNETDEEDEEDDAPGISIETGKDGTLKLCCDDPEVLQAAQVALSEYLNRARRSTRMSAEERAEKKERRKSMPLQPTQQKEEPPPPPLKETRRAFTGSTPNLAASLIEGLAIAAKLPPTSSTATPPAPPAIQYSREKLLEIREGIEPSEIPTSVLKDANHEVIAELQKPSTPPPPTNGSPTTTATTPS